jgi:hypothetical protein
MRSRPGGCIRGVPRRRIYSGPVADARFLRATMCSSETACPQVLSPVIEMFVSAFILAEEESALEIGVDHLLAALDSLTTSKPIEQATGPAPHRYKALSSEAKAAIEAAGAVTPSDLQQLTVNSLRRAFLAAKRGQTK